MVHWLGSLSLFWVEICPITFTLLLWLCLLELHTEKKNHISFLCLKIAITSLFKVKHPHLSESLNKVPQSFTILVHSFFFFILVHSLYCSTCCRWLSVTHLFKTICHHFFYIFPGSRRCSIKHFDQLTMFLYISTDQQNCYTLVNTLYSPQLK